ncbi:carbohydrate-binding module family 1 protein [Sphaerobolus stellatus SS14]|uniref:Carbohydrate-binding module family 1 protein n=1 Tax=Sphaerobolus stellatus (strain SS14) TaxID=990650 RepID=A0A0C9VG06_SPHS4|nr:carbohydrate-binding module family 1 protein [Sphaerobolus stellatus SS14]
MRFFIATSTILVTSLNLVLAQTQITVNLNSTLQEIDGFGVSQAFGRAEEFYNLASGPRQQGLDYLFSTSTGAGLTIIRNRIGSGGSGDSILPNSPGSPSGTPQYVWDGDDSGQVWFSKQAMSYGVNTIYADAWSAPGFMKTNGNQDNGGWLCGVTGESCSSGDWRQPYANFLTQYVKYYLQEGIPVTHLGFLNEPDYVQAASFIPTLYNTLKSASLSNVSITCCDSIGWPGQRTMTSALVSAGMEQYLGVITSHAYNGDPDTPLSTKLKTWETEAADLNSAWCTTWYSNGGPCEGLTWANKINTGIVNANLSAYLYWEGVEVNEPQASSYLVASDGNTVTPSGRLWAFAMWSRFIRPGALRLSTSGSVSGVGIGAFKNTDGTVVVVFTNTGSGAQSVKITLSGFTPSSAAAYLTDNTHQVASTAATLSGGAVTVSVPAYSVVTVTLRNGGSPPPSQGPTTTAQPPTTTATSPVSTTTAPSAGSTCKYSNAWYSQCL